MSRKKTAQIQPPVLDGATKLGPLDLNAYHFDKKHTVLTPQVLEAAQPQASGTVQPENADGVKHQGGR